MARHRSGDLRQFDTETSNGKAQVGRPAPVCHLLRNVATDVAALKHTPGGNILVYGSATLVKALLYLHLVDELRLMVFPVAVGGGLRLFDDNLALRNFNLIRSQATEKGVLMLEYQPVG